MDSLEKAKISLRKHLLENKEKVLIDLEEMRKNSSGDEDISHYVHLLDGKKDILFQYVFELPPNFPTKCGNPWMKIKCEECNQQILSFRNLGLASWFDKDDEDPWKTGIKLDVIKRYVCIRCSNKMGYDD